MHSDEFAGVHSFCDLSDVVEDQTIAEVVEDTVDLSAELDQTAVEPDLLIPPLHLIEP